MTDYDALAKKLNALNDAMVNLSGAVKNTVTAGDLERFIEPDWPFIYEGFRYRYRCHICGKVITQ